MAEAPELLRPTTTFGLTAEEMEKAYVGMAGRILNEWIKLKFKRNAEMGKLIAASELPRWMSMAIASVASADGEFSDLEKAYLAESVKQMSGQEVNFNELGEAIQRTSLEDAVTNLVNAIPEEMKQSGPFSNAAVMMPRVIVFRAMAVSAQDGLERLELDAAYAMGDRLGVDRETVKRFADLLRAEQTLFLSLDSLLMPGGSEESGNAPRLLPQQTTAGLTQEDLAGNQSYIGLAGFAIDAWMDKRMAGENGSLFAREEMQQTLPLFFSLCCIVAKGDGVLSELEEKKLRTIVVERGSGDEARADAVVNADPSTFDTILGQLTGIMAGFHETFADHPLWSGALQILPIHVLIMALVVAAQDGLERAELNVAYQMGERLNVDKDTTRNVVDVLRQEAEISAILEEIFGA